MDALVGAAGDSAATLAEASFISASVALDGLPSLLDWLSGCLFSLLLPEADTVADSSFAGSSGLAFDWVCQRESSHASPVKLFSLKVPFVHLLVGFPDLSRARSPALMAP